MKSRQLLFALLFTALASAQEKDSVGTKLDEIILTNEKKTFTNKNGNLKIDVANSTYKSSPNVLDLLAKLPKIQISPDRERISVVGKGDPLIYIDNAKADIETLNALSMDDIKSIEIISNPSVKYEADGKVVILITLKASRKQGFQTTVSENMSFKKGTNLYHGINANLKLDKTEIRGNFNYNDLIPWESNANNYKIPAAGIASNYIVAGYSDRKQTLFGGSIFRQLNDGDYISVSFNGKSETDNFRFRTLTNNLENNISEQIETHGNNAAAKHFVNFVGNYSNRNKVSESGFFIGLQYSRLGTPSRINSANSYNRNAFMPFMKTIQDFTIGSFTARIDFDKKFNNGIKFETGALHASSKAKTDLKNTDFEQGTNVMSTYKLDEKIASAYVQVSGEINKVNWSAGIRAENTDVLGEKATGLLPTIDRNYTNLFPKAQLDWPVDSTKTITINYSKSISRPGFSSTNQGVTYINPYFVFAGNTNLNPSISDELSANFQYRDKSLKIGYYKTKDNINYSYRYDGAAQLLTHRLENFDKESGYSIELTAPFSWRFWTVTNVCSFNVNEIQDTDAIYNAVKPFLYYYSNHIFKLKNDWTFSATGWGMTTSRQGILENKGYFILNADVSKTYKNWTFSFAANDIFRNMNLHEKFEMVQVSTVARYFTDTREFAVSVKYTFGKFSSRFEEKAVDENVGRIR